MTASRTAAIPVWFAGIRKFWMMAATLLVASAGWLQGQSAGESGINPDTVLVSRFNFVRPPDWQWVETLWEGVANVQQSVTFKLNEIDSDGDCFIYVNHFLPDHPAGSHGATAKRWKEAFTDVRGAVAFGKPVMIGTNRVSYVEMTGTFIAPKKKGPPRRNFTILGAIIDDREGNVVLRVMGSATLVRKTKPAFKKMIEDALKDQ